jgi:hypothetical protein
MLVDSNYHFVLRSPRKSATKVETFQMGLFPNGTTTGARPMLASAAATKHPATRDRKVGIQSAIRASRATRATRATLDMRSRNVLSVCAQSQLCELCVCTCVTVFDISSNRIYLPTEYIFKKNIYLPTTNIVFRQD